MVTQSRLFLRDLSLRHTDYTGQHSAFPVPARAWISHLCFRAGERHRICRVLLECDREANACTEAPVATTVIPRVAPPGRACSRDSARPPPARSPSTAPDASRRPGEFAVI